LNGNEGAKADGFYIQEVQGTEAEGSYVVPLEINVELLGVANTDTLGALTIEGLPVEAELSAGERIETGSQGDTGYGRWQINPGDLEGLTLKIPEGNEDSFELSVSASSTGIDGQSTVVTANIPIKMDSEGPYIDESDPAVASQSIEVQGVYVDGDSEDSEPTAQSDLESFAATDANGGSALSENLSQFESSGGDVSGEDVPALDEQVDAAQQDFDEQDSNGLGEPEVVVADDNGEMNSGQEDVPPII
jgi:hypothetical protein